ncbi:adenylate/guanylate cyclase domain-containing protein [Nordella sp. HKS 07]|uniref:adenylate/guanylate cyclase domain-containing protein n=1 Tax=Nordella sp. HKS 07 TaxID=2712222 RepID=UPI0013E106D9|nr:adenylate/guanylate cyclase domain-containing protein [Nordella sp. HKS 07]QIG46566.1 adenylate/guanylate cyclase domain-containing protein [Nordella sp. HKS 07]
MERKLAAILAADVVGYSRLMGQDEAGTLQALKAVRAELIDPRIAEHKGRVFKATGDGLLAEFPSVVNAVACAIDIQRGMHSRTAELPEDRAIRLRIGVHVGDVIIEADDIFGDGVNVAARLEGMAPPGGVVVSGTVRDHLGNRLDAQFHDMGEHTLKNIDHPIRVFQVQLDRAPAFQQPTLALPDKPSIAVLPFDNLSSDRDQDYFADGIVEEIITALTRMRWLFVIARNSSFAYKGRAVDVKQIGRELGVRYILEGSVRKSGDKVRITGQLIDTSTGAHLWADRIEGGLENIFDFQDQVTTSVIGAISPRLEEAEIERAKRKPTENLDAYDYYLRGLAGVHQWTRQSCEEALSNFYCAIHIDPSFAAAYGMAARTFVLRKGSGWVADREAEVAEAVRLARRAAQLGKDDAVALSTAGIAFSFMVGNHEEGKVLTDRAIELNPNSAWAWLWSGWIRMWLGEPEAAIDRVSRALRLNPTDPHSYSMYGALAHAHFFAGRFTEALSWAEMAVREKPDFLLPGCMAAASSALAGRIADARRAMGRVHQLDPSLNASNLQFLFPLRRPEDLARLAEGLRLAGLPE